MGKVTIDAIDRKILQYLVRNARMPFLEIARECGISGAAIHQRVKKLDDAGVILGSRLEVDPKSLGYDMCAIIGIKVSDASMNFEIVKRLEELPEITECHFITGQYNILIKLYCYDNSHLMATIFDKILDIPWISDTETFISLKQVFSRQVDVANPEDE
ncbi:Lrp/AsnC ligand binding domain-containing protein [Alistipes sp. OttesenSCG-928-B03]|nr:Lrp/AsnC ligand binding domain-containing protein [Alistipes sp. OttesenSCG-928-B03]